MKRISMILFPPKHPTNFIKFVVVLALGRVIINHLMLFGFETRVRTTSDTLHDLLRSGN